jgi:hypothetical protein
MRTLAVANSTSSWTSPVQAATSTVSTVACNHLKSFISTVASTVPRRFDGHQQPTDIIASTVLHGPLSPHPHTPIALAGALGRRPPGFFSLANTTADAWLDARSPGGSSA